MPDGRWVPFPDPDYAADYRLSDLGRVRRVTTRAGTPADGRIIRPALGRGGHPHVQLSAGGVVRSFGVGPAVARAFLPTPPPGHLLAHRDEDRTNCAAQNLLWVPPDDPRVAGRRGRAARALSPEQAAEAIGLRGAQSAKAVAKRYGVSDFTIRRLWRGM